MDISYRYTVSYIPSSSCPKHWAMSIQFVTRELLQGVKLLDQCYRELDDQGTHRGIVLSADTDKITVERIREEKYDS